MVYKHRTKSGKVKQYQSKGHYERSLKGYFASQNQGNKGRTMKTKSMTHSKSYRKNQYKRISGKLQHKAFADESLRVLGNDVKNLEYLIREEEQSTNADPKFLAKLRMLLLEMKTARKIVQMEKAQADAKKKDNRMKHKVSFVVSDDHVDWVNKRVKEGGWGDADNFFTSKEYADEHPMLLKLENWEQEIIRTPLSLQKEWLEQRKLSYGDEVYLDYISGSGKHTYKGKLLEINNHPYVELSNGRQIPWHRGWKNKTTIHAPPAPVFDNTQHNNRYARKLAIEKFLSQPQKDYEWDLSENAPIIYEEPTPEWFKDPKKSDVELLDTKTKAVFGKVDALKSELRYLSKKPKGVKLKHQASSKIWNKYKTYGNAINKYKLIDTYQTKEDAQKKAKEIKQSGKWINAKVVDSKNEKKHPNKNEIGKFAVYSWNKKTDPILK